MIKVRSLKEKPCDFGYITAQFCKDFVIIGDKKIKLGQISTEMLELSNEKLEELSDTLLEMKNAFIEKLYGEYKSGLIVYSYKPFDIFLPYLEKAVDKLLEFPLFNVMPFDKKTFLKEFREIYENEPQDEGRDILNGIIGVMLAAHDEMLIFRIYVTALADSYLEKAKGRNSDHYAHALYRFLCDEKIQKKLEEMLPKFPVITFRAEMPVNIEYVTCPDPYDETNYVIAERIVFKTIGGFLNSDFYKALSAGFAPRRCHNCGRYFLHLDGYNTCYCNRIAPNDKKGRTCRKIGAHIKEQDLENKLPAETEYKRAYGRLKKRRGKSISYEEWNEQVMYAQNILASAKSGAITDIEAVRLLKEI